MSHSANRIGIIGGGQLAKMLAMSCLDMNIAVNFWLGSGEAIIGSLGTTYSADNTTFEQFCEDSDKIIFEHEHVHSDLLAVLTANYQDKCPALNLLLQTHDRLLEKQCLQSLNLPCAPLIDPDNVATFPVVIKQRQGGYDGRGQIRVDNTTQLANILATQSDSVITEAFVDFESECSLVCVRDQTGRFAAYDITENLHQNGMLVHSHNIPNSPHYAEAVQHCQQIAEATQVVGVFAVEFFITANQQLLINEISPRVHNSGHWTLDGAFTNQFENHIRTTLGMSIGHIKSHSNIRMTNLTTRAQLDAYQTLTPRQKLYHYGKTPRDARKLGHVNEILQVRVS